MDWIEALVLGIVQGATEYLPVSSSGHLVIAQDLIGLAMPAILFDVVLHTGTLTAVVAYYHRDIRRMIRETLGGLRELAGGTNVREIFDGRPWFRLASLILLATIPTAILGIGLREFFERAFGSVGLVGSMLILTGLWLSATRFTDRATNKPLGTGSALIIGLVQGIAIMPGISRSGATIATAMMLGIGRNEAARFSFLLSIPSIIGALLLESGTGTEGVPMSTYALGFVTAAATGYVCLNLLLRVVDKGRLHWFSPYCIAVGLFAVLILA